MLEFPRDYEEVMLHDIEFVQQAHVSVRYVCNKHVFVVWQKRVGAHLALGDALDALSLQLLYDVYLKADAALFDILDPCRDLLQSTALNCVQSAVDNGLPERAVHHVYSLTRSTH